jgi:hypothetical protein
VWWLRGGINCGNVMALPFTGDLVLTAVGSDHHWLATTQ